MNIAIEKIISLLVSEGMTQSQIGKELDCSQSTVSDLLAGKIGKTRPSHKMVMNVLALAKKHGIASDSTTSDPEAGQ